LHQQPPLGALHEADHQDQADDHQHQRDDHQLVDRALALPICASILSRSALLRSG
jgi:hypothetical protein